MLMGKTLRLLTIRFIFYHLRLLYIEGILVMNLSCLQLIPLSVGHGMF